jgi:hypothetical protein
VIGRGTVLFAVAAFSAARSAAPNAPSPSVSPGKECPQPKAS